MKEVKNKTGILFWITGLSGSGKSSVSNKIINRIRKIYGPTLLLSGDDIRKVFVLNSYSKHDRRKYALQYSLLCKKLTNQNINVIFSTMSLFHQIRFWNKKNIKKYVEIYIKADIKKIIKKKKKFFYRKKSDNVIGVNIKPELPKSPDIVIKNDFKKNINELAEELLKKINSHLLTK
jgi:adenylylsulfate kinase-like enzyme